MKRTDTIATCNAVERAHAAIVGRFCHYCRRHRNADQFRAPTDRACGDCKRIIASKTAQARQRR